MVHVSSRYLTLISWNVSWLPASLKKFSFLRFLKLPWFLNSVHWTLRYWIMFRACHFCAINFRKKLTFRFEMMNAQLSCQFFHSSKFFLWSYLKGRVWKDIPQTVTELKQALGKEITSINSEVWRKGFRTVSSQEVTNWEMLYSRINRVKFFDSRILTRPCFLQSGYKISR